MENIDIELLQAIHTLYINNQISQKEAAKRLHMRESRLKLLFTENNLKLKKQGRQPVSIDPVIVQEVINYVQIYRKGYKTTSFRLKMMFPQLTESMTKRIYEEFNLFKYKKPKKEKIYRIRYLALFANQIWHTDLHYCTLNGELKYLIIFLDDRTRFIVYYEILQNKSMQSTSRALRNALNRFNAPECLVSDNGLEFIGFQFQQVLQEYGIRHWTTQPYNPEQNGKCERVWWTLEQSKQPGVELLAVLHNIILEYNNFWPQRGLYEICGRKSTPFNAWNTMIHWHRGLEPGLIFYE